MKKCIIMGNGPSLNKVNMDDLKGVDTFSFNRAYLSYEDWGFCPTYYGFYDRDRIKFCYEELKNLLANSGIKKFFFPATEAAKKHLGHDKRCVFLLKDKLQWIDDHNMFGAYTLDNLPNEFVPCPHCMGSVCITAIQFLYALGYTYVGMVGVDARYVKDSDGPKGQNHFRKDYLPGKTWSDHIIGNSLEKWKVVGSLLKRTNKMKLYSCTEGSRVNGIIDYLDLKKFMRL